MNIASPIGSWHDKASKLAIESRLFIDGEIQERRLGPKIRDDQSGR